MRQNNGAECSNYAGDARVNTEVVRPLRRGEHEEEHAQRHDDEQALGWALRRAQNLFIADEGVDDERQCEEHGEHRKAARQRAINRAFEQSGVANVFVVPVQRWAHGRAHAGGFQDCRQGLIAKN